MVVVLPDPLTPTTRITCGRREGVDLQRFGHGREDLGDLLGDNLADLRFSEPPLEPLARQPLAHLGGGGRAEIGGDQRFFDLVERIVVQHRLGEQPGEVVAEPVGGLLEPAPQPIEPPPHRARRSQGFSDQRFVFDAHDAHPVHVSHLVRPERSRGAHLGLSASAPRLRSGRTNFDWSEILAMALAVPLHQHPLLSPNHPLQPRRFRRAVASRSRRARSLATNGATCGIRAAGVPARGEKGKICPITMSQSSISLRLSPPSRHSRSESPRSNRRRSPLRAASP